MAKIVNGLIYEGDKLIGVEQGAPQAVREAYMKAVRWEPVVERFVPSDADKAPDGRVFQGVRVGDQRDAQGKASVTAPNGNSHTVDCQASAPTRRYESPGATWTLPNRADPNAASAEPMPCM
jgi:hypothetical protein